MRIFSNAVLHALITCLLQGAAANVGVSKRPLRYSALKQKAKSLIMIDPGKLKSVNKVTKRVRPMSVLHFLSSVYDYIMERDLLCVTAARGRPCWRTAANGFRAETRDAARIQNGVVCALARRGRPPTRRRPIRTPLSASASGRASTPEVKGRSLGNRSNGSAERIKPTTKYALLTAHARLPPLPTQPPLQARSVFVLNGSG